jgi:glycosyltransferase involved in cell wall biosynthesis
MEMNKGCIQWRGRLNGHSGYAVEGRSLIRVLRNSGYRVLEVPVPPRPSGCIEARIEKVRRPGQGLTVVHLPWPDHGWEDLSGKVVWRAMFETAAVPPEWLHRLAEVDEVWVPSRFNAGTFTAAGVDRTKVRIVPQFVDQGWLQMTAAPYPGHGVFKFLSVFRWQERKGWDVLLQAYLQEFDADDDVELILRVDPFGPDSSDIHSAIRSMVRRVRPHRPPRLRLLPSPLPPAGMKRLFAAAHAFVLPTRGEAWGRPFMEAMACRLITIGTAWGGHLDFMDADNSLLVDCELVSVPESAAREWPYFRGQTWAEPSIGSLRSCMRRATDEGPALERLRSNAAAAMRDHYSRDHVQEVLTCEVDRLLAGRAGLQDPGAYRSAGLGHPSPLPGSRLPTRPAAHRV